MKGIKGFKVGLIVGLCAAILISTYFLFQQPSESNIQVITDREYYDTLHKILSEAKETIHITNFELKYYFSEQYKDSNVNQLVQDLIDAHNRGVEVKYVVDEYGNRNDDVVKVFVFLKEKGLKNFKLDNSKVTTHTKLIIVDGEIVLVGSSNWSHTAINKNHEANVLIHSADVAQEFERYFNKIWKES